MIRPLVLLAAGLLAGCAESLAEVERLSELGLPAVPTAGAFPGPGESADDPGVVAGLAATARGDVDGVRAAPGQVLPFGRIATACGVADADMGTPIAAQASYAIYDTAPTIVAPRTHFVTGFDDGCARQFTAALALFGDLATHETMRYAGPQGAPYSATDTAYEQIKGRVCGARSGQPCGDRLDGLSSDTAFVSVYPAFGDSTPLDILLHRGEVAAADF